MTHNLPYALRPKQVVEQFGISRATLYRKIYPAVKSGLILHVRVGKALCIITHSLIAYLEGETDGTHSER